MTHRLKAPITVLGRERSIALAAGATVDPTERWSDSETLGDVIRPDLLEPIEPPARDEQPQPAEE